MDELELEQHNARYECDEELEGPWVSFPIVPGTGQFVETRDEN
jgi:hypothetical protein